MNVMELFSGLGLFAIIGIGFAAWLFILLVLFVADAFWTNGLATTYMHATSTILTQFWSFLQAFLTFFGRVMSFAPRAMQIGVFFLLGVFFFGLLMNWFMLSNVVCASGVAYEGSIMNVWAAKALPQGVATANTGEIVNNATLTLADVDSSFGSPDECVLNIDGIDRTFPKDSGLCDADFSNNSQVKVASGRGGDLASLFSNVDRTTFINNALSENNESFKRVDTDGGLMSYTCDASTDEPVISFLKIPLTLMTFLIITLACLVVAGLKFFNIF
jgi:hypothetical protein